MAAECSAAGMDRCGSVFCIERFPDLLSTLCANQERRNHILQPFFPETFFQNFPCISVHHCTLFLYPFLQGKRESAPIMEIPDVHTKLRVKLKRLRNIFACMVALRRRTFLFTPAHHSDRITNNKAFSKIILVIDWLIPFWLSDQNI